MLKSEFSIISDNMLSSIKENLSEFRGNEFAENLDLFKSSIVELYEQDYFNIRRFLNLLIDIKTQIIFKRKTVKNLNSVYMDQENHFYDLFSVKNDEYVSKFSKNASSETIDVLENFKSPAYLGINLSEKRVLLGYVLKHFMSLVQILEFVGTLYYERKDLVHCFADNNKEILNEKFGDVFIYMLLLNAIELEQ